MARAERFKISDTVRDVVIGMSDGLTVPFALAAGVSAAIQSTHVVIAAGLAEVAAGSIAMGLGGYLAAKGDAEHYENEVANERRAIQTNPDLEKNDARDILVGYGLTCEQAEPILEALEKNEEKWIDFMMRLELGLEKPDPARALRSASTIAISYVVGGFVPLFPYFIFPTIQQALPFSVIVTLIALAVFGYVKSKFLGSNMVKGAVQTVLVGGIAAAAAFELAQLVGKA